MFLDWVGILLLVVPIFMPILLGMEFDGLCVVRSVSRRKNHLAFALRLQLILADVQPDIVAALI